MNEQNDAAAPAAAVETHVGVAMAAPVDGELNMFQHPTEPAIPPEPIPDPPHLAAGDVNGDSAAGHAARAAETDGEIVDVRKSALEESYDTGQAKQQIVITLGDIVYYGDGTGIVHPAIITHVYGSPASNDEDRNDTYVDLHVFRRKHITDVDKVPQHTGNGDALNGWVFKA